MTRRDKARRRQGDREINVPRPCFSLSPSPPVSFSFLLRFVIILVALTLPLATTRAQETPAAGTAPAPLANTGTVVMVSQTVDASIVTTDAGVTVADVSASTRLHNTSKTQAVEATLGWPSWAGGNTLFTPDGLSNFTLTRAGEPLQLSQDEFNTTWNGETRTVPWWQTAQPIGRDERVSFQSSWVQSLGNGPLVTFRFGLLPAGNWSSTVGSTRVTIDLPSFTQAEQIVTAQPAKYDFDGERVEWVLTEFEPVQNIQLTLIAPPLWNELQGLRDRVANTPEDVDAWLRLADIYTALSDAGVTAYETDARSALLEARRVAPDAPEPHRRLWQYYRDQIGEPADLPTLELAIIEAKALLGTGADNEEARTFVVDGNLQLAEAWLAQNTPELAIPYLREAEQFATGERLADVQARRRAAEEEFALITMVRAGLPQALEVAAQYDLPRDVPRPWLDSIDVQVRTDGSGRTIAVTLDSAVSQSQFEARLNELGSALQSNAPAGTDIGWTEETGSARLEINMNRTDPGYWVEASVALLASLPDDPALDVLRSALQPSEIEWRRTKSFLQEDVLYREEVALQGRASSQAETLQARREETESQWEAALVSAGADAWRRLESNQRARYTVEFDIGGRTLRQEWTLSVPAKESLRFQTNTPRLSRWLMLGGTGVGMLLLTLITIWRWPLQRKPQH